MPFDDKIVMPEYSITNMTRTNIIISPLHVMLEYFAHSDWIR